MLKSLLTRGDWLMKLHVDPKDAIPIKEQHRKYLCFQIGENCISSTASLWLSICSMGLYQDPKASNSSRTRAGDAVDCLHR